MMGNYSWQKDRRVPRVGPVGFTRAATLPLNLDSFPQPVETTRVSPERPIRGTRRLFVEAQDATECNRISWLSDVLGAGPSQRDVPPPATENLTGCSQWQANDAWERGVTKMRRHVPVDSAGAVDFFTWPTGTGPRTCDSLANLGFRFASQFTWFNEAIGAGPSLKYSRRIHKCRT